MTVVSPQSPWRSLERVNAADLKAGDKVLFRRGEAWRGTLLPHSGREGAPITYGAYGEGEKPLLLGSVSRNEPRDWHQEGDNIWATAKPTFARPRVARLTFSVSRGPWMPKAGRR